MNEPVEVDLRPLAAQLPAIIEAGIRDVLGAIEDEIVDFADGEPWAQPEPQVSSFGIYIGEQGLFCVVQANDADGLNDGYGVDSSGTFSNNMPDWRWYLSETPFEGEGYRDFPHQDDLVVIDRRGTRVPPANLFPMIAEILRPAVSEFLPFAQLPRTTPFRVGLQPIGGRGEFWLIRDKPDESTSTAFDRWVAEVSR